MTTKVLAWSGALLVVLFLAADRVRAAYVLDDSVGLGRRFDGIGGLSGGGVSH